MSSRMPSDASSSDTAVLCARPCSLLRQATTVATATMTVGIADSAGLEGTVSEY